MSARLRAYGIGVLFALGAAALQWAILPLVGSRVPFLFYLPSLGIAAATLGPGPALIVLLGGLVNGVLWLPPVATASVSSPADRVALLMYLAVGVVMLAWGARVRVTGARAAQSEERLRHAQADTGVGLVEVDFETKTVFVTPTMTRLLDKPFLGERISLGEWIAMLPPDEFQKGSDTIKARLRQGSPGYEREHMVGLADGSTRWLMSRVHLERDARGRLRRLRCASVDITQRKQLEAMLRQARDDLTQQVADLQRLHELTTRLLEPADMSSQLRAILDALADFHGTRQGVLLLHDPSQQRLVTVASLGFSQQALRRLEDMALDASACGRCFESGQRVVVEDVELDRVGSMYRAVATDEGFRSVHATPLATPAGDTIGVMSVYFERPRRPSDREMRLADICARKAAVFVERARALESLREADRRKDEFLATLAHELRNPLAPVRQAAAISRAPGATDAQKRWSHEVIDRQVQQMALLLDDLLDVSRITRGVLQVRKVPSELGAVVDAAVETVRPLIETRRHTLRIDLPAEPVAFEVDPLRVAQVIANLLGNAAKYTEPGGQIELAARRVDGEVELRVTDNGIGMRKEAMGEIFEMFTQVRSDDRSAGGLGIGLALAKGLVGLHGGTIEASSEGPGRGSTFVVRLPVGRVQPALAVVRKPGQDGAEPAKRILVADDNRDAAESLAELLRLSGHEVTVAFDGAAALDEFVRFHPQVALLDIGMPKMDGNAVATAIRRTSAGHDVTLVAITGWGQEKDRSQAMAAGFDHHLTKPVDPDRVQELLAAR
jgi:PAS domain S-box-containing protein